MKEKSKRKTNLKSSIIVLLLVAILLIASSYAWFTSNQTVTISSLDVSVQTKGGLQISVDGTNWKSIVQNEDLKNAINSYASSTNQLPAELEPVSTVGTTDADTGFMNMYYGSVVTDEKGDYLLTAAKDTETSGTEGKFIAFDLFFKVEKDTDVYLSTDSNVITQEGKTDRGLQNAARVAFIDEGNTAQGSSIATIQGLKGAINTYIWEPNYNVHTAAAVGNAYDTYDITTTETSTTALPYDGIKAVFDATYDNGNDENGDPLPKGVKLLRKSNAASYADLFATVSPTHKTVKDFEKNLALFTLTQGITKMRVYMWIEGQDVDCENNASGTDISFNLQITQLDA